MSEKKYQVFISSTYKDLMNERLDISRSVLDVGHIPAAMENFPAMDEDQLRYIKRIIDQCDYYVIVLGGKYGSTDENGVSYTELEYDYAKSQGKFILGFPFHDISKLTRSLTETEIPTIEKLELFRQKVMSGRLVRTWEDRRDLELKVVKALSVAFSDYPQAGWVRTPKDSNEELLKELNDLRKKNEALKLEIEGIGNKHIISISDIADIDEKYNFTVESTNTYNATTQRFAVELSWRYILVQMGFCLKISSSPLALKSEFARKIMSLSLGRNVDIGSDFVCKISDREFTTIFLQMQAYGFMVEAPNGTIELSRSGMQIFLEDTLVRTKTPKR